MSQFLTGAKPLAPTFTFGTVCDNISMKKSRAHAFDLDHPLLEDRERLERIADTMYAKIQKVLFPRSRPVRRPRAEARERNDAGDKERILNGTGVSADDVLSEALEGLLKHPPERLESQWEGLAVTIAENKAIDALRASGKGLSATDHRSQLYLVSGDREREGPDGEKEPSIFETLPSEWSDLEAEYFAIQDVLKLRDLAPEVLNARDLRVFFAIHYEGYSRKEVGDRLGLTSQRVGQIYSTALSTLEAHSDYPFKQSTEFGQLTTRRD